MRIDLRAYRALTMANFRMAVRNPIATFSGLLLAAFVIGLVNVTGSHEGSIRVDLVQHGSGTTAFTRLVRGAAPLKITDTTDATARRDLGEGRTDLEVVVPAGVGAVESDGRIGSSQVRLFYNPARSNLGTLGQFVLNELVTEYNDATTHAPHPVTLRSDPIASTRN